MVWYFLLLKNFPQFIVIHITTGFGIVSKASREGELISSFLQSFTGGPGQDISCELIKDILA